jgi:hypothetical protein
VLDNDDGFRLGARDILSICDPGHRPAAAATCTATGNASAITPTVGRQQQTNYDRRCCDRCSRQADGSRKDRQTDMQTDRVYIRQIDDGIADIRCRRSDRLSEGGWGRHVACDDVMRSCFVL